MSGTRSCLDIGRSGTPAGQRKETQRRGGQCLPCRRRELDRSGISPMPPWINPGLTVSFCKLEKERMPSGQYCAEGTRPNPVQQLRRGVEFLSAGRVHPRIFLPPEVQSFSFDGHVHAAPPVVVEPACGTCGTSRIEEKAATTSRKLNGSS